MAELAAAVQMSIFVTFVYIFLYVYRPYLSQVHKLSGMTLIYDLSNIVKIPERSGCTDTHQISTATGLNLENK